MRCTAVRSATGCPGRASRWVHPEGPPTVHLKRTSSRHHKLTVSTGIATAGPSAADPSDTDDLEGEAADSRPTGRLHLLNRTFSRLHLLNRTYKGQAASTLALSCSNSAWVMAPLSSRRLADAISSAALLEDSAATDLT
jgi:hypothetical protein